MAESATLKIGHHWRSMKSTTAPWRKPVVAPEGAVGEVAERAAGDQPGGDRAESGAGRSTDEGQATTTTMASTEIHGPRPLPLPMLNAVPVLNARLKRREPTTSIGPSTSRSSAQALVSWSTTSTDTPTRAMSR